MRATVSLLLIGNIDRLIIKGIWIEFSDTQLGNWCRCIEGVYNNSLTYVYRTLTYGTTAEETIKTVERKDIEEALVYQYYIDNLKLVMQEVDKCLALYMIIESEKHLMLAMR